MRIGMEAENGWRALTDSLLISPRVEEENKDFAKPFPRVVTSKLVAFPKRV